ncbi:hypothetical protein BNJ_00294 [Kaumoebavirus]|uniref:hypothetical protein n=1 Tax=Kaumoebavirus TaxID=1859492 RepID=UPI0009C3D7F4|nr:hypothetical protein BNJ_00294 [Kaumoebavirus]ARA72117.1 hypothetical protein BNJ_00294 [Kaumoebavirus]
METIEVKLFFRDEGDQGTPRLPEGFSNTTLLEKRDGLVVISGTIFTKNFFDTELFEKNPSLFGYEIL